MSDDRWFEIDRDVESAIRHLGQGIRMHGERPPDGGGDVDYSARMAFMHAMQSGHTSLESALVRILKLLRERVPDGDSWHSDLINRAQVKLNDRPAILAPPLAEAAHRTRAFRHVAMRAYDSFDPRLATPAVEAAMVIVERLREAVATFREQVDP